MPAAAFGNDSVIEKVKKDPGLDDSPDNVEIRRRDDLGKRITTMALNEPTLEANLAHARRFWPGDSDKPPAWVESDDELLELALADTFDCRRGRPKNWKEG